MFKKTIKYKNFLGQEVEKDFYFHLSKAELIRMAAGGTMEERLNRIIQSNNNEAIFQEFEDIIRMAVGVRSEDGDRFIKDDDARSRLMDSPAYDELMVELMTGGDGAVKFITELIPPAMQKELKEQIDVMAQQASAPDPFAEKEDTRPLYQREHRDPSPAELQAMSAEEMKEAFRWRQGRNK